MPAAWSQWPAPAKLNLFLHITGRREDGYHELETVFQLLDRGDRVRLRRRDDGQVRRVRALAGVAEADDLTVRAAQALRAATGCRWGVDIELDKHIPLGGGLGGGSSDAASVLVGLDAVWDTALGEDALAELGRRLGADVPVFVRGRSAWATGVGDRLTALDLPARSYVIVDPQCAVPTAALFQVPELTRNSTPTTIADFRAGAVSGNVFAPVVRKRFAPVAAALDWLGRFGDAQLSGSGGCGFVAVASMTQAEAIARQCPPQFRAWVAQGVDESPLLAARRAWRRD